MTLLCLHDTIDVICILIVKTFVCYLGDTANTKTNNMYLRYFLNENGDRQYTLATVDPSGKPTLSAHPARFSPEDKYSRQRITIKKRFGLLITQQPEPIH